MAPSSVVLGFDPGDDHEDGGEGSTFHSRTILTAENIQGLEGDGPTTVIVQLQEFENANGEHGEPHVYLRAPEAHATSSLSLTSPQQVRLLGEALIDAADALARLI